LLKLFNEFCICVYFSIPLNLFFIKKPIEF
jgi:hypothetical protein